ncbi:pbsX family transcriptional regulator [Bacillus thuringiensis serovar tolworthi]|uniref:PbsX family transcriptional regulator n=1 Tax=Bacillus thuringiensis subsp. tolworthi TaxID=1442 RepID=A0A9W4A740_BACTO|nr:MULTISPECIES: helix-turn-helix transcriptional regulator [Bacillus cereus group]MEB8716736.1 helix-turn-helix transcriptional regulator [Bacillus cereus]MRB06355.1 helix-turn-helix domain-containing protein [Bacillus thuringiensis]MEB9434662.1 helix-turn-helix transcriptional regulator [Bacillus cereus]MEB9482457.1 helix-turn-helix transcriptional regulator [Bacillus cereus]MEB9595014.1 helix-turn-helix transcriptional regulator [Bacillus cereus]
MHKNLYIARKERRMTQVAAAKLINIAQRTYYSKEQGKHDFTLKEAQKLAKYFKTTVDELFEK